MILKWGVIVNKVDQIVSNFAGGYYCSQAILSAYCEDFGLDKETAVKLSCGMAAGLARLGHTCGAVLGAYMVISLKYGNTSPDDMDSIEKTFSLIQNFDKKFCEKHGSTNCKELLGVDLRNDDKNIISERVGSICPVLVRSAAEILESIV